MHQKCEIPPAGQELRASDNANTSIVTSSITWNKMTSSKLSLSLKPGREMAVIGEGRYKPLQQL